LKESSKILYTQIIIHHDRILSSEGDILFLSDEGGTSISISLFIEFVYSTKAKFFSFPRAGVIHLTKIKLTIRKQKNVIAMIANML
jgi:hypothetical protein